VRRPWFVLALFLLAVPARAGDVAIILNPANTKAEISLPELTKIFKLDQQRWETGEKIELVLQEAGSGKEAVVLERIYHMSANELKKHWLGKVFRGELTGIPKTFASDDSVKRFIKDKRSAIGFIDSALLDPSVKPLKIDGKLPGEPGYALSRGPS
jgi:ABC-type phosphate transport system substrate-binding protein